MQQWQTLSSIWSGRDKVLAVVKEIGWFIGFKGKGTIQVVVDVLNKLQDDVVAANEGGWDTLSMHNFAATFGFVLDSVDPLLLTLDLELMKALSQSMDLIAWLRR